MNLKEQILALKAETPHVADCGGFFAQGFVKAQLSAAALVVASEAKPGPVSDQNARYAIDEVIERGRHGVNPPPTDDHWLMPYWKMGQKLAARDAQGARGQQKPVANAPFEYRFEGNKISWDGEVYLIPATYRQIGPMAIHLAHRLRAAETAPQPLADAKLREALKLASAHIDPALTGDLYREVQAKIRAALVATPPAQSAWQPELRNISKIERSSDQGVTITFTSARACSAFIAALSPAPGVTP